MFNMINYNPTNTSGTVGLNKVFKLIYKSLVGRSKYDTIGWPGILEGVELVSMHLEILRESNWLALKEFWRTFQDIMNLAHLQNEGGNWVGYSKLSLVVGM